ncbi:MAG: hypothetical protein IKR57_05810 [Bacilli bacterium]|nr:hypothetical protein [Bacilli bacterium]
MHLTHGYDLTTAITNLFIFVTSVYGFIKIKDKKWKLFYLFMSIDSLLGALVHGIYLSMETSLILWLILAVFFTITINTLFSIFLKFKIRYIIILSVLLSILVIVQLHFDFNFILTFALYVLVVILICIYHLFKDTYPNKNYFIYGFISQVIGGIIMLSKIKISILDHNGIYHLFMVLTLIFFYIGITKKK